MIWDFIEEYLKRFYSYKESQERLPRIANYYKNYLKFFCSPFFKDFKKNEMVQIYGDDKAKAYYKNNYGIKGPNGLHDEKDNKEINNNRKNKEENSKEIKINNEENKNEEINKSLIFNTNIRCNIENNVITRSSLNTKNEASNNYDSFFESSFSKINALESKKNFLNFSNIKNTEEANFIIDKNEICNNKNTKKDKNGQESFVNLLNNLNANSSFTYYMITEENSIHNKGNLDLKTGFFTANIIKPKDQKKFIQKDNNAKDQSFNNLNKIVKDKDFNFKKSENIISKIKKESLIINNNFNINNRNEINNVESICKTPNFTQSDNTAINNKADLTVTINSNPLTSNALKSNKSSNINKSPQFFDNKNSRNLPNNFHKQVNTLNYKNQINEQSKIFKNSYNDLIKESTNKLLEKQNILNKKDKHNAKSDKKTTSNDKDTQKVKKEKDAKKIEIDLKSITNGDDKSNKNIKNKQEIERSSSSNSNLGCKINRKPSSDSKPIDISKANLTVEINGNYFDEKNKNNFINNLFSIENNSNNINIEGNSNLVININPALNILNNLQNLNNYNNKIYISPEKLLYDISNKVGSPVINSIVNINIKPILQVNNNPSKINIFNTNRNPILSNNNEKEFQGESFIKNKNAFNRNSSNNKYLN
jgi:hypothetical protein